MGEMRKSPEEIKKGLSEPELFCSHCQYSGEPHGCNRPNGSCQAFDNADYALAYIQQLEAQMPKWISVEERKPKDQEIVLLGYAGNLTDCGYYDEEEAEWCNYESIKVESPTHWMPKPEPPKEG